MFLCLLCAFSSSIDSLSVSIIYGAKRIKLPIYTIVIVSLISTFGTFLSMKFGNVILSTTEDNLIEYIGSLMLIFMGTYFIYDTKNSSDVSIKEIINNPSYIDYDNSGKIDFFEAFFLAAALTINNIVVGIASAVAGLSIFYMTLFTFIITFFSVYFGYLLGKKYISLNIAKYTQIISGALIILIGLFNII